MRLTELGKSLYEHSRIILEHFNAFTKQLRRHDSIGTQLIRIAAIHTVGLHELPPYLQAFFKKHPDCDTRLIYRTDEEVYSDVSEFRADVGIVAYPEVRTGLEVFSFRQDQLVVIAPPEHPVAEHKKIRMKDLNGQNFVAFSASAPTRKMLDKIFYKMKLDLHIEQEFENIETIKSAVAAGLGIAIVPQSSCVRELQNHSLSAIQITDVNLVRPLGILVRKTHLRPQVVNEFISILKEK
jgi:DNA-binding transcriptional LysR family regulator